MTKREMAGLICKSLGIYLIVQGISVMSNVVSLHITTSSLTSENLFNMIFSFLFLVIFGVILWLFSDKLSAIMVKGDIPAKEGSGLMASDIQRVSFSVLGLFFVGDSLPELVSNLTNMYTMRDVIGMTPRLLPGVVGGITQTILGLAIFLGAQGLVNILNTIRNAGLKREVDYEENE